MNIRIIETRKIWEGAYKAVFGADDDVVFYINKNRGASEEDSIPEKFYCTSPFEPLDKKLAKKGQMSLPDALKFGLKVVSKWSDKLSKSSKQKSENKKISIKKEPYCPSPGSMYGT